MYNPQIMTIAMTMSPLTFEDCEEAARLHQEAFFKGWSPQSFQESLQDALTFGLKVMEDDVLVGYLLWREVKDEAEILTLVVDSSKRRQGIGNLLLRTLFTLLKEKEINNLFIEVAEDNQEALSFYDKNGFVFISKRPHYYPREINKSISALNFIKKIT